MESWKCGGCGKWIAPSVTFCDCQTESKEPIIDLPSVKIGNQIWTTENFDGTKLKDGSTIPIVECSKCWSEMKTPAMCYYDNDKSKGVLYNWYAVKELKVPDGWRVPTDDDWKKIDNIKVKETDLNLTCGGYRSLSGSFYSTEFYASNAWGSSLYSCTDYIYIYNYTKSCGFSVRLVRDL